MSTSNLTFGHEGSSVEFKTSIVISAGSHDKDQLFVVFSAACAMMNTEGGNIFIGVKDNGEIALGSHYGVRGDKEKLHIKTNDEFARWINQKIAMYFCDDKYVRGKMHAEEYSEDVICIIVKKADKIVYMHERTSSARIAYRRERASSRIMDKKMISQRENELAIEKAGRASASKQEKFRLRILEAIERKRKIILFGYSSSNSDSKSDRIIEPIKLICDGRSLWGYEEAKEGSYPCRQFRLCRIGNVNVLDEEWSHEIDHKEPYIDAFEWSRTTEPTIHISILVGPAAKNHLIENSPETEKYLFPQDGDQWVFDTNVHSLEPVKRVCRNFMDTINVCAPIELKKALEIDMLPEEGQEEYPAEAESALEMQEPLIEKDNQKETIKAKETTPPSYGLKGLFKSVKLAISEYLQEWRKHKKNIAPCMT